MAKVLPYYVMDCGVSVENSYWIPTQVLIDKLEKHVQIVMTGFRDYESRLAGRNIIGSMVYHLWGDDALEYINKGVQESKDGIACAYAHVENVDVTVRIGLNDEIEQRSLFTDAVNLQDGLDTSSVSEMDGDTLPKDGIKEPGVDSEDYEDVDDDLAEELSALVGIFEDTSDEDTIDMEDESEDSEEEDSEEDSEDIVDSPEETDEQEEPEDKPDEQEEENKEDTD